MARFRNDFGEDRVVPSLGYVLVPAGETVPVPDDEWPHWDAAGWTALDPDPNPAPPAADKPADAIVTLPVAATPAPPPAPVTAPAATPPALPAPLPAALQSAPKETQS